MKKDTSKITGFHAHVYYDPESRGVAARVRRALGARFDVQLGRWHDKPVGPHPKSMYQVAFSPDQFDKVVPWLMLNHKGLDVLIHPSTSEHVEDHSDRALWLGKKLRLNIGFLRKFQKT